MTKRIYISVLTLLVGTATSIAQISPKDSIVFVPLISPATAINFPGGDMVNRFGINGTVGGSFTFKTRKNWVFGIQYDFLFGKNVKEQHLFDNLETSAGFIIDDAGEPAEIDMFERGHTIFLKAGMVFPHLLEKKWTIGPNENCGILITGGMGFLQHKIEFTGTTPQLSEEYQKGYDRLSNGFATSQFIGYQHLSNNRMLNFYFGVEFVQAWTVNKRGYNFDQMAVDNTRRLDLLSGFKIGWLLPLYKRVADEFYYD
ncbi:hypothetical protein JYT14_00750 [Flavobacteriales bacterium AH-315-E23]|nr:hypothetical protein [Flavobacteriales bacterium AH-315-E23]